MTDELYNKFYLTKCPRPKKDVFQECLLKKWQNLIEEGSSACKTSKQFITGREGNRKVDLLFINDELIKIEKLIIERLLETEEGMDFLEVVKHIPQKMLTFCCLGCQVPIRDYRKDQLGTKQRKAQLINETIAEYYLRGTDISNSTIQLIEEQIKQREIRAEQKKQSKIPLEEINEFTDLLIQEKIPQNERNDEKETDFDAVTIEHNYLDNWDDLSYLKESDRLELEDESEPVPVEDLENAVIEISDIESNSGNFLSLSKQELEQINFSTVEDYFLEGEQGLTETLIDHCPKINDEKYDVTCDAFDDTYYLASRKLIHLFIYQNELFKTIDLSADCLLEQKIDVKELRRLVELHIRKYTKWELSKEKKNKFILCTLCHKIREYKRLGQLDLLTAVKAFFVFMGKIFQLPEKELKQKMEEVIRKLQLDEPRVIGEVEPVKTKPLSELLKDISSENFLTSLNPRNNDKEDVLVYLESVWKNNPHRKTKTDEEISELRRRARRIVKERRHLFKIIWEQNDEFRPYLAIESLEELKKQDNMENEEKERDLKTKQIQEEITFNVEEINREQIDNFKDLISGCINCSLSMIECRKRKKELNLKLKDGSTIIKNKWEKDLESRPCIAKVMLEKLEKELLK